MVKSGKRLKRMSSTGRFSLGGSTAENDPLLSSAFYVNADYQTMESQHDRTAFIIGRTGAGKSASFDQLRNEHPDRVILLNPEDLALPYLTNLDVIQRLVTLDVHLEPFFKALWKHVMVVEVLRHRYRITTPESKHRILAELRRRLENDRGKRPALDYLEEFGDKFWCETDERVRQVAEMFKERIEAEDRLNGSVGVSAATVSAQMGVSSGSVGSREHGVEVNAEVTNRYQRVVNEAHLPRLNQMIQILNDTILDSPHDFTYILIDDLDRGWIEDTGLRAQLVRCLFEAVMDMSRIKHLKILVALRTNIFGQLDYGSQKYGLQEEKIASMIMPLRWTEYDLRNLLEQRVLAASTHYKVSPQLTLDELLPHTNRSRGSALDYILARTLLRPRDAISYMNLAIKSGGGRRTLSWDNIWSAEEAYSLDRLRALRDEWKDPYYRIDVVLEQFKHRSASMTKKQLFLVIDDIATNILGDAKFQGAYWLNPLLSALFEYDASDEAYLPMVQLLYKVGFLGVASSGNRTVGYSYEAEGEEEPIHLTDSTIFEVHPAFRVALRMTQNRP